MVVCFLLQFTCSLIFDECVQCTEMLSGQRLLDPWLGMGFTSTVMTPVGSPMLVFTDPQQLGGVPREGFPAGKLDWGAEPSLMHPG